MCATWQDKVNLDCKISCGTTPQKHHDIYEWIIHYIFEKYFTLEINKKNLHPHIYSKCKERLSFSFYFDGYSTKTFLENVIQFFQYQQVHIRKLCWLAHLHWQHILYPVSGAPNAETFSYAPTYWKHKLGHRSEMTHC